MVLFSHANHHATDSSDTCGHEDYPFSPRSLRLMGHFVPLLLHAHMRGAQRCGHAPTGKRDECFRANDSLQNFIGVIDCHGPNLSAQLVGFVERNKEKVERRMRDSYYYIYI